MQGLTRKLAVAAVAGAMTLGAGLASAQVMGCPWWYNNSVTQAPNAQPQYYNWMGPQMMFNGAWMQGPRLTWQDRQALLQGRLNLSDNQKQAFKEYTDAVAATHKRTPRTVGQNLDANAKLQQRIDNLKAKLAAAENLLKARNNLVAVLTPEQVQTLSQFEMGQHRHHRMAPTAAPKAKQGQKVPTEIESTTEGISGHIVAVQGDQGITYYYIPDSAFERTVVEDAPTPVQQPAQAPTQEAPAQQPAAQQTAAEIQ